MNRKKWAAAISAVGLLGWLAYLTVVTCTPVASPRSLGSVGGLVLTGGGGLSKVTTGNGLSGSGTSSNPLRLPNDYAGTRMEWVDDMLYQGIFNTSGAGNAGLWSVNGSGTITFTPSAAAGRPGVLEIGAATATTGRNAIQLSSAGVDFNSATWEFQATVGFPTLSTATDEYTSLIGFADTSSSRDQVDGCFFAYDRGNAMTAPGTGAGNTGNLDRWSCWCSSNSSRTGYVMDGTVVSSGSFTTVNQAVAAYTAPSTNIYTLRIQMTGTTLAEFYVNGTKSCQITTSIPNSATRATGVVLNLIRGAATASRALSVDRVRVVADLPSARTP